MRQLSDASRNMTLARAYAPYGNALSSGMCQRF
jgi:hypothetical protein